jgi:fido (protein-threonine AMPylation protein)
MIEHPALRRLLDLDAPERHDRAAAYLLAARELELYLDLPVVGDYDVHHLQAVHRFLHRDAWPELAGALRRDQPTLPYKVSVALRDATPERLSSFDRQQLADELGVVLADLALLDPFAVGSGRAARAYANLVANDAGWVICWQRLADHPQLGAGSDPRHALAWLLEPASPAFQWREFTRQLAVPGSRTRELGL